jgi:glutathione S-transferase
MLTYFDGRGHGERVRYALAAAGMPYTEVLLKNRGDMDAVRARCLFGQVPLLDIGGLSCIQSWATVRHIAAISGMVPKDPALAWRADAVGEQVRDFFVSGNLVGFGWGERDADLAKAKAAAATHLPKFEAILSDASPYCCGAEPNWADFQLLVRYRPRHPFFSFAARTHFSVRLPFSIISHARRSLPAYAVRVKLH